MNAIQDFSMEPAMDEIKRQLMSPGFWVVTVFLSLALSVVGAYLKEAIDRGRGTLVGEDCREAPRGE
jgi:hypothetical protein